LPRRAFQRTAYPPWQSGGISVGVSVEKTPDSTDGLAEDERRGYGVRKPPKGEPPSPGVPYADQETP